MKVDLKNIGNTSEMLGKVKKAFNTKGVNTVIVKIKNGVGYIVSDESPIVYDCLVKLTPSDEEELKRISND